MTATDDTETVPAAQTAPTEATPTRRWRGIVAVALSAAAVGVLTDRPDVLLLAGLGTVYAAYPLLSGAPEPTLSVRRRLSASRPRPGERVEVTLTVRNDGDRTLMDVRVVDGVPPGLSVVEGSPRLGCLLRPGASASVTYTVDTTVGCHRFEPTTVLLRNCSGSQEVATTAAVESRIRCGLAEASPPLSGAALTHLGPRASPDGGSGIEFRSLREYLPGDPARHIAWAQYARTGEPATVEFVRERRTEVVLLLDARPAAYRGRPGQPHAVQRAVAAADAVAATLLSADTPVGLATLGRHVLWVPPGRGRRQRAALQRALTTDGALSPTPPESVPPLDEQWADLRARLGPDCQVVVCSPLLDDAIVRTVRRLAAVGVPVSVLSPDVTARDRPGERVAALERRTRVRELRGQGVTVLDWDTDEAFASALAGAA